MPKLKGWLMILFVLGMIAGAALAVIGFEMGTRAGETK